HHSDYRSRNRLMVCSFTLAASAASQGEPYCSRMSLLNDAAFRIKRPPAVVRGWRMETKQESGAPKRYADKGEKDCRTRTMQSCWGQQQCLRNDQCKYGRHICERRKSVSVCGKYAKTPEICQVAERQSGNYQPERGPVHTE